MRRFVISASPGVIAALWMLVSIGLWTVLPGRHGVMDFVALAVGGAFAWFAGRRQYRTVDYVTGPLTRLQRVAVYRGAATGVAPSDPSLHRAALDLARFRLAGAVRDRLAWVALYAVLIAGSVVLTVTDRSLWWALFAGVFGAGLVSTLADPPRLRRRVERLEQATGQSAYPAPRA